MLEAPALAVPLSPARADPVGAWVETHFAFVWRALRRLGLSPADADDAAQQVFVVAARRARDVAAGSERGFLYGTAVRVAAKVRRGYARRPTEPLDEEPVDPRPGADELVDQRRARDLLDRVLGSLDDDARAVFVLHEIEGLTMAEIARALEIPPGTVASRLRRGRESFSTRVRRLRGAGDP